MLYKAKGGHLDWVHSDQKVLKMIRRGGWFLLSEAKSLKLVQETIKLESTKIRWFSGWLGGRLVCVNRGWFKGYILWSSSNYSWKASLGSEETSPKTGRVTALIRANLLFLMGFDEGGVVVDEDDDEWGLIKLITGLYDSDSRYWWTLAQNSV